MLALDQNIDGIQAFPLHSNTVTGVLTNKDMVIDTGVRYSVLHSVVDGNNVTATFLNGSTTTLQLQAGGDIGLCEDIVSVSTTADCWLS